MILLPTIVYSSTCIINLDGNQLIMKTSEENNKYKLQQER